PASRVCRRLRSRPGGDVSRRPFLEGRTAGSPLRQRPRTDPRGRPGRAPRTLPGGADRTRERAVRRDAGRLGRAGAGDRPRYREPSLSSNREPVGRPCRRVRAGGAREGPSGRGARAVATVTRRARRSATAHRGEGRALQGSGHRIEHARTRRALRSRSPGKEKNMTVRSLVPLVLVAALGLRSNAVLGTEPGEEGKKDASTQAE